MSTSKSILVTAHDNSLDYYKNRTKVRSEFHDYFLNEYNIEILSNGWERGETPARIILWNIPDEIMNDEELLTMLKLKYNYNFKMEL